MSEVQIGEHAYLCDRMPTRVQYHVYRRLLPALAGLRPLFARASQTLVSDGNGSMVPDIGEVTIFDGLAALGNTLGMMHDSEADYILDNALDAVRWKQAGRWMPLRINGQLTLQAADQLDVQLRLTGEVLRESLANFSIDTVLGLSSPNGMDQNPSLSH